MTTIPDSMCLLRCGKCGHEADHETKLGGYCREALRDCIKRAIDARPRFLPENA